MPILWAAMNPDTRREAWSILRSRSLWIWSFAIWTALAFATATFRWVAYRYQFGVIWPESLLYSLCDEWFSAVLTPPLFAIGAVYRPLGRHWKSQLAKLLAASLLPPALVFVPSGLATDVFAKGYGHLDWQWSTTRHEFWGHYLGSLMSVLQIVAAGQAFLFYRSWKERERAARDLEIALVRSRLDVLMLELQPHFLFNALNTAVSLVRRDPAEAERVLVALSDLLRYVLRGSDEQEVPLRRELEFVGRYLDIEKVRFGDRLEVHVDAAPDCDDCAAPNLILHPLVENAVRHGVARRPGKGIITLRTRRAGDRVRVEIDDDGPGLVPPSEARGTGLGLKNTRERLLAIYGDRQRLALEPRADGGTRVTVEWPAYQ